LQNVQLISASNR